MNDYELRKLCAEPLRKCADDKTDWNKVGKHLLYGGAGAGTGALINYLLGNKSLVSYLVSGGLGAGAGLGIEALANTKEAEKAAELTPSQNDTKQDIEKWEDKTGENMSQADREALFRAKKIKKLDVPVPGTSTTIPVYAPGGWTELGGGVGLTVGLGHLGIKDIAVAHGKAKAGVSTPPSIQLQYEQKHGRGSGRQLTSDVNDFIALHPNDRTVRQLTELQQQLSTLPRNSQEYRRVEAQIHQRNTKLRNRVATIDVKGTPAQRFRRGVKGFVKGTGKAMLPGLLGAGIGYVGDVLTSSADMKRAKRILEEMNE